MKYLQTQNMMMAPALITVISFVCNIGLNAALIDVMGIVVRSEVEDGRSACLADEGIAEDDDSYCL
jgi:peptidoglycan biosynthesis protein MviN/MurJ (putative lipid II flippase)